MSVLSWLDSRIPAGPDPLQGRVRLALRTLVDDADEFTACFNAAATLLERTLEADARSRETAFDLLAADALITYAFEAAADDVNELDERAARAMRYFGALGTDSPSA